MRAHQILQHNDDATLWTPEVQSGIADDVAHAYQCALAVRRLRQQRGEMPRGFKIGFTNRSIWPRYNVFAPIWGTVWDTTLTHCDGEASLNLAGRCQPRLEPEAVFGFRATPVAGATLDQLFDCIEWVAPGFELVQSHAPDWKFTAALSVADGGLHSHLLVGKRTPTQKLARTAQALDGLLAHCQVALHKNSELKERGAGRNVLDGPLLALHYFLNELRQTPGAPDLLPGDVVTTGTWTDAWPVSAGETWRAEFEAPLSALTIKFV